jgi:DNA repair protein RecN (Recombination protein N)
LSFAFDALTENEQSIVGQMHSLGNALVSIGKYAPKLGEYSDRFANMIFELREMSNEFEKIADQTDHDPERILEAQQRLDLIYRLQKKHIVATVEDLLNIQSNLEQQLAGFADLGNEIGELRHKITEQETHLFQMADDLADRRQAVIPTYEDKIVEMLGQLAMPYAQLKIETRKLDALGPTGLDEVQFMFAANRGSRLQQIKDVASGGELSRLALVTKSLVASSIPLPTLIFDEIDAGISGDVALKMGNILRNLSNEHQVVTITHSPQVASKADRHYFVFKVDKPERTVTNVRLLSNEDRIRAIAVMLSQSPPSDSAMENARELLGL